MTTSPARHGRHRWAPAGPWMLRVDPDGPSPMPPEAAKLVGERIPGRVPGAVHDDLLRAGLIPDPFVGENEDAVAWVSHTDWVYETVLASIDVDNPGRIDLVFDGLDTFARIDIDGVEVGRTANMFRAYRFDVTERLVDGENHVLAVHLTSAYTAAEDLRSVTGPRPNAYPEPFNFVRKMACGFGWDWGITLPGAGIWQPVGIETWSGARISELRPLVDVVSGTGILDAHIRVERSGEELGELTAEVLLEGEPVGRARLAPGQNDVTIHAEVPSVRQWHPVGYGEPELYRLTLRLRDARHVILDAAARRIGFRRLYVDREPDGAGTPFTFHLGDDAVFVKGINWIPGDVLPGRMTRQRYRDMLTRAADVGCNLVRVWGGGLYETRGFYDACDEFGLMVWQDFAFACAAYPEDEPLRAEVLAEARDNVARLSSHPSLVLWNGNNENLWLREVENWMAQPGGDLPWGEKYYLHDLPAIVADVDPSRPYTAGSPWSGSWEHEPNDVDHQTHHSWDVWNKIDYVHYRDSAPRFVAEFGWQAPPASQTLRDAVTDDPIATDSPGVMRHQKAAGGMEKLARGLVAHFPPRFVERGRVDAWHYLTQLNQARAIETGVMHWRAHWPHTAGTIIWQLNDVWPVISWSAIDGAGRAKPLYHALREIYADRALAIEPDGAQNDGDGSGKAEGLVLCVINDSPEPWRGEAVLRRINDAGPALARRIVPVDVGPREVQRVPIWPELAEFTDEADEVLVAELDGRRALWYAAEPKDTAFAGAAPLVDATPVDGGLRVTVTATSLLRDCLIQPDRIHPDATCDRGFFTLLPGESTELTVRCREKLSPAELDAPWALTWLDRVLAGGE